jgi:hypothetical protein
MGCSLPPSLHDMKTGDAASFHYIMIPSPIVCSKQWRCISVVHHQIQFDQVLYRKVLWPAYKIGFLSKQCLLQHPKTAINDILSYVKTRRVVYRLT